jgi:hypothetical protein
VRQPMQFVMNQWHQSFQRLLITIIPGEQHFRDVL